MSWPHIFHKWTKWEPYIWQGKIGGLAWQKDVQMTPCTEDRQKRTCEVCGYSQDVLVGRS